MEAYQPSRVRSRSPLTSAHGSWEWLTGDRTLCLRSSGDTTQVRQISNHRECMVSGLLILILKLQAPGSSSRTPGADSGPSFKRLGGTPSFGRRGSRHLRGATLRRRLTGCASTVCPPRRFSHPYVRVDVDRRLLHGRPGARLRKTARVPRPFYLPFCDDQQDALASRPLCPRSAFCLLFSFPRLRPAVPAFSANRARTTLAVGVVPKRPPNPCAGSCSHAPVPVLGSSAVRPFAFAFARCGAAPLLRREEAFRSMGAPTEAPRRRRTRTAGAHRVAKSTGTSGCLLCGKVWV